MSRSALVAVTSRSFSKNILLKDRLQAHFKTVKFNEQGVKLVGESLKKFLYDAELAIIGLEVIDANLLDSLPNLKVICKMGTGVDKVDLGELKKRKIAFSHTPGANKRSVSELVLGHIFTVLRQLSAVSQLVKEGSWVQPLGKLLSAKTVGIIGFGAVGQDLSVLLAAFGCRCLIYDVLVCNNLPFYATQVDLDVLLAEADIISLHIPLTSDNYHFIGEREFSKMKATAVLINTARGGLVDEEVLYKMLKTERLYAAALDVFEEEPHVSSKLLELHNFFATSHIGGSTEEAIEAMGMRAIDYLVQVGV